MKNINAIILLAFTMFAFSACTNEQELNSSSNSIEKGMIDLTQEELASISFDDTSALQEEDVFSMVTTFINQQSGLETRNVSAPKMTVKTKSYINKLTDSENTRSVNQAPEKSIPIYEVAVENGNRTSYAIVSADRRDPGILALFDNFPTEESEIEEGMNHPNTRAMLTLAKRQLIVNIANVEQLKMELRDKTVAKICRELNIPASEYSFNNISDKLSVNGDVVTRNHIGVQEPLGNLVAEKKPLCQIIWEQKPPYNGECPMDKILIPLGEHSFVIDGRVPAGCVTIACIHAEACVERPSIGGIPMDWSYYKTAKTLDEKATPAVLLERARKVIRYIYDQLGSSPIAGYHNGMYYVHATGSSLGESYIKNNFNYQNDQSFDPDVVLSSLNAGKPIYVSGLVYGNKEEDESSYDWEGHAFIIDGYMIMTKMPLMSTTPRSRSNIVEYYDMYWHINLGWGGNSNAYFRLDSDASCTPQFDDKYGRFNLVPLKNMSIISHLSKK